MTYSEFKATIQELHTGASMFTQIDNISKLVLGKIAKLRLKERVKIKELTVGGNTEFNLLTEIPDFFAIKSSPENGNRDIYYYQSSNPFYLVMTNNSRFVQNISGGFASIVGRILKVNFGTGITVDKLYIPYYSKYLVQDSAGNEKETPDDDDDIFLFNSIFDDVFVDGVLLYLKRKELSDSEFTKAQSEWNKSLQGLAFYQ
jgi:hypothetical protein